MTSTPRTEQRPTEKAINGNFKESIVLLKLITKNTSEKE